MDTETTDTFIDTFVGLMFAVNLILIATLIFVPHTLKENQEKEEPSYTLKENQEKEEPYCMCQEHFFKKATPVALSYDHSMVVLDIKQELFEITATFHAKCGQEIYLFNPFDVEGRTACWNPLSYISTNEANRVDDLNQIAISLIPDSQGGDSFFVESRTYRGNYKFYVINGCINVPH